MDVQRKRRVVSLQNNNFVTEEVGSRVQYTMKYIGEGKSKLQLRSGEKDPQESPSVSKSIEIVGLSHDYDTVRFQVVNVAMV
jgi:hypothetical protein